ncbi:MAG: glycosyltransferase family 39 protein [Anaerolineae bacterium]|nr:glycosyltransferase family 39 protein [Anaerolineae bacterium]
MQLSLTTDEPSHLGSGYTFIARGTAGLWTVPMRGHPLLVDAWNALPLYLGTPDLPLETLDGWKVDRGKFVEKVVKALGPFERTALAGRVPTMLLTILLAATVYRWGTDLWGPIAGSFALLLLVFDPTLLAHGRVATNDAGVTAFGTLFLYLLWRWQRTPSWSRAASAGFVAGLTMLAKGSGILWPAAGCILVLWRLVDVWKTERGEEKRKDREKSTSQIPKPKSRIPSLFGQSLLMGATAFLVLWEMYGFAIGPLPGLSLLENDISISVPAPLHWRGLFFHTGDAGEHLIFALGQIKTGRWWWYFPFSFLIKNPLPLVFGVFFALGSLAFSKTRHRVQKWRYFRILGTFVILYISVAITTGPNIGYRHILPLHPLLYLFITGTVKEWGIENKNSQIDEAASQRSKKQETRNKNYISRFAFYALLAWYILGTLRVFPYELTFFNELVGGPEQGWRYLADSNTDWQQSWKALHDWQEENDIIFYDACLKSEDVAREYDIDYLTMPLNIFGSYVIQPTYYPEPGDYVIRAHDLSTYAIPYDKNYTWFRHRTPDAIIANSLYYYHVPAPVAPAWLAQCAVPAPPLDGGAIEQGFGMLTLRLLTFDCTQSWIYPHNGDTTGWYALHDQQLRPDTIFQQLYLRPSLPHDSFTQRHLADIPQSVRQRDYHNTPAFALYEWTPSAGQQEEFPINAALPMPKSIGGYPTPAGTLPSTLVEADTFAHTAIKLEEPFTFLGTSTYCSKDTVEVETWWQVTDHPIQRSFSLMAHLLTPDGTVLGVADGLGISSLLLQTDDIIVQRHRFSVSPVESMLWLRTGAYWLDDGTRWSLSGTSANDAIFVPITNCD